MLNLLYGRAGSGKTTRVLERLCREGALRPQILIVPEPQSHEAERLLCKLGGDHVSRFAEVLSFTQLATRVLQTAGGMGIPELDNGGRILLMHRAVQLVADRLTVYSKPSRRPRFLQALLATVDELKSSGTKPEDLVAVGEELSGTEGDKLRDLGLICGTYHALTLETALDPRERLTRAAEKLMDCSWAEGKDFWLDGFIDFTHQQGEVLRQLLSQANCVTVTLTCDDLIEREDGIGVFSPAKKTASYLKRLAKEEYVKVGEEVVTGSDPEKAEALLQMEKTLFSREEFCPVSSEGAVQLFRAGTMRSEVEWTAAQILCLVREKGYRFRDIGVVTHDFESYRDLICSVFARYDVPVFASVMTDILEKPVLALITAALECVANGYRYEDVFRYLKTGLTDLPEDERDRLENYAVKWSIRGSQWTQKKQWNWHPKGYGFKLEPEDAACLKHLDMLRRKVVEPLEKLQKNTDKTGGGQAKALYSFMEQIGVPERLGERVDALRQRGQLSLAEEYRQLWDILCGGLEQCAALLGDNTIELEEFSQLFRLVLSQYDVGSIPVSLDRVTAGEMSRQTGHRVKVLFLLGADDATIPKAGNTPGLLSDDDRARLAAHGMGMHQYESDLLYRELTTVYQTCALPSRKLIISWHSKSAGGEERRPCFLADRFRLLFSDLTVVEEETLEESFRLAAPKPALELAGRSDKANRALAHLPEYKTQLDRVAQAAGWERGTLSKGAVDRLYGRKIRMSASRMDQYRSCQFAYFMRYGLEAEPRRPAGFHAPEYGTFVHAVLEEVLKDKMFAPSDTGERLRELGADARSRLHKLTQRAVERYVQEELGGLEGQSQRFKYLFHRLLRSVQAVIENVAEELFASKFYPIAFELGFGQGEDLPPVELTVDGVTISVSGFVDRVDGWIHDGRLYLRVVDYKTGRKSFDLTEIWNGLGLQMLLYLFTLEQKGESLFGQPVESAGVLYLPARDALLRGSRSMSDVEWKKTVDRELRRSGLVLEDKQILNAMELTGDGEYRFLPLKLSKSTGTISGDILVSAERLGKLSKHIQKSLEEICLEFAKGAISANPYWRGNDKNACRYCDYAEACHFEEGRGGDCRRWLPSLSVKEFWENLEEL